MNRPPSVRPLRLTTSESVISRASYDNHNASMSSTGVPFLFSSGFTSCFFFFCQVFYFFLFPNQQKTCSSGVVQSTQDLRVSKLIIIIYNLKQLQPPLLSAAIFSLDMFSVLVPIIENWKHQQAELHYVILRQFYNQLLTIR